MFHLFYLFQERSRYIRRGNGGNPVKTDDNPLVAPETYKFPFQPLQRTVDDPHPVALAQVLVQDLDAGGCHLQQAHEVGHLLVRNDERMAALDVLQVDDTQKMVVDEREAGGLVRADEYHPVDERHPYLLAADRGLPHPRVLRQEVFHSQLVQFCLDDKFLINPRVGDIPMLCTREFHPFPFLPSGRASRINPLTGPDLLPCVPGICFKILTQQ